MDIITRKQLSHMPNGTVFTTYKPDILGDHICVINGQNKERSGFNGVIYITPNFQAIDKNPMEERITNWCSVDVTEFDYDEAQLFAVFSKTEVKYMINVLIWALSGCSYPDNFQDRYVCGECEFDEEHLSEWTDNKHGLTLS